MGNPVSNFDEGTPAWRVYFPVLVIGWETLRPVLVRWGLEAPEVLDASTTVTAVRTLRSPAIEHRLTDARNRLNLKDIQEAEAMVYLANGWVGLATWAARYERCRREGKPTALAWLMARKALLEYQETAALYGSDLTTEA